MRTLNEIKQELQEATARRADLWKELGAGADEEKSAEVARLNERIEELWQQARVAANRARFGDQGLIIRRARAEERLERDLAKVA
jgi:hypothetical protein